jgi:hypothetical protein
LPSDAACQNVPSKAIFPRFKKCTFFDGFSDLEEARFTTSTPAESAPITVNEPSIEPSLNRNKTLPRPGDVSESVWADFLLIRKTRKSALTETALAGIRTEAEKAGMTMDEALAMCCTRGWQSLRADWVKPDNKAVNPADIARVTVAGTKDLDPALVKIIQGNAKAVPPPQHIRKRMSQLLKGGA